ncbi:hypothetical protein [Avibacterium endocarditidis]|uniref:hypothetical protein n=1 Tax=Avibacterium TaxID=292486 RepID=UPI0039FDD6B2
MQIQIAMPNDEVKNNNLYRLNDVPLRQAKHLKIRNHPDKFDYLIDQQYYAVHKSKSYCPFLVAE